MIVFENIQTGETIGIDQQTGGEFFDAKLTAAVNSSNMSINSDRGQDKGWRLLPEQQAIIEEWETDPEMVDMVSKYTKIMVDDLRHADFLSYMVYLEGRGKSPERAAVTRTRQAQMDYEKRVEAIKSQKTAEPLPVFNPKVARKDATVDDFLSGDITGDSGGDKVQTEDAPVAADALAELDKTIADAGAPPVSNDNVAEGAEKFPEPKAPKAKK